MSDQLKGLLITALGVLFVVPDALFIRVIDADVLVIAFWRLFLSSLIVLIWQLMRHGRGYPRKLYDAGRYGLIYALFGSFSAIMFVFAIQNTSVANVVFIIATMPVFAAFYSWLLMGERISRRMVWTIIAALIGIGVIALGSASSDKGQLIGDLAALIVAATFAMGITAARKARPASMLPLIPVGYGGGSLVLLLWINPFAVDPSQWWIIGMHGGLFIAVSTCLLAIGPRYITSAEVALFILLESILAPLLVWFALGEEPGHYTLIGGAILLSALLISNLIALRRK